MTFIQKVICGLVLIMSVIGFQTIEAQSDSAFMLKETPRWLVPSTVLNKKRLALFTGSAVVGYSATMVGLN